MNGYGPLLSVRLSVDYPAKTAVLHDACFDVEPGEILGLVGESGSGRARSRWLFCVWWVIAAAR